MTEDGKGAERVTFSRGYDVCIMAIDGTWRRDCQLNAISDTDADADRGRLHSRPQSQGVLPAAVVDRPRLSPVRTRSRQRHGNGHPLPERQARQEAAGRLVKGRRGDALRPIAPRGRMPGAAHDWSVFSEHALGLDPGERFASTGRFNGRRRCSRAGKTRHQMPVMRDRLRPADQITLNLTPFPRQERPLLLGLDALRDDRHSERAPKSQNGSG